MLLTAKAASVALVMGMMVPAAVMIAMPVEFEAVAWSALVVVPTPVVGVGQAARVRARTMLMLYPLVGLKWKRLLPQRQRQRQRLSPRMVLYILPNVLLVCLPRFRPLSSPYFVPHPHSSHTYSSQAHPPLHGLTPLSLLPCPHADAPLPSFVTAAAAVTLHAAVGRMRAVTVAAKHIVDATGEYLVHGHNSVHGEGVEPLFLALVCLGLGLSLLF